MTVRIREYQSGDYKNLTPLVAGYRQRMMELSGRQESVDLETGRSELEEFIDKRYLIFVAEGDLDDALLGFAVARVIDDCVWAEAIYVSPGCRRHGVATELFKRVEQLALDKGKTTAYQWVHPDNSAILSFLRKQGYDVLNLIEVRKARPRESFDTTINILGTDFRY